jgi:hypothetical protein
MTTSILGNVMSLIDLFVGRPSAWDQVDLCDHKAVRKALDDGADPNEIVASFHIPGDGLMQRRVASALGKAIFENSASSVELMFERGAKTDESVSPALRELLSIHMPGVSKEAARRARIVGLVIHSGENLDVRQGKSKKTLRDFLIRCYTVDQLEKMGMTWEAATPNGSGGAAC